MPYLFHGFTVLVDILRADPAVFWFLLPIMILWVVMEFYFSEYRREPLGWNSMLGNSVSLLWVVLASIRVLGVQGQNGVRFWLLMGIGLYALVLILVAYRHAIPQRYTYILSGPSTMYSLSMVAVLWGQAGVPLTGPPLAALVIVLGVVVIIFQILRNTVLGARGEVEAIRAGIAPEGPRER